MEQFNSSDLEENFYSNRFVAIVKCSLIKYNKIKYRKMKKNKIVVSLQLTEETNANTGKKWGFYNIYISKFKKKSYIITPTQFHSPLKAY